MNRFRIPGAVLALAVVVFGGVPSHAQEGRPLIKTMTIEGAIGPAAALYVHRSVDLSEKSNAQALIIHLDTPGGLDDSMRAIVKDFFDAKLPVVVYVSPKGARAASAGAIITLASHVAAMSPGTAIGAAHPVMIGGGGEGEDEKPKQNDVMSKKMEEDAAAYARSIAKRRGRNVEWAELAVRQSISATEEEAKQKNVIDIIANNTEDLLKQLHGRKVKLDSQTVTLNTQNARTEDIKPSFREQFLHVISNPNIVLILMTIAMYGIIFELSNPGSIFPGVIGGIALILALYSFAILPINLAGVLLIVFAMILFIVDLFVPGFGILTAGGIISFVIGALILFETPSPVFRVSLSVIITLAVLTGGFFLFAVGAAVHAQRAKVVTGGEGMVDQVTEARTDIDPKGKVFLEGSYWKAISEGEPIKQGERVRVVGVDKLTLRVRKET